MCRTWTLTQVQPEDPQKTGTETIDRFKIGYEQHNDCAQKTKQWLFCKLYHNVHSLSLTAVFWETLPSLPMAHARTRTAGIVLGVCADRAILDSNRMFVQHIFCGPLTRFLFCHLVIVQIGAVRFFLNRIGKF
jgi:hypothetical protein